MPFSIVNFYWNPTTKTTKIQYAGLDTALVSQHYPQNSPSGKLE